MEKTLFAVVIDGTTIRGYVGPHWSNPDLGEITVVLPGVDSWHKARIISKSVADSLCIHRLSDIASRWRNEQGQYCWTWAFRLGRASPLPLAAT